MNKIFDIFDNIPIYYVFHLTITMLLMSYQTTNFSRCYIMQLARRTYSITNTSN